MKIKNKYPLWKLLLVGKEPLDRKHKPNIIEYAYLGIGNFMSIALVLLFSIKLTEGYSIEHTFSLFQNKIIFAFFIGNYLVIICTSSRLIFIQKKTEEFRTIYLFTIIFSLSVVFAPIAIIFCLTGFKNNIIEFV